MTLTETSLDAFTKGHQAKVPLMIGMMKNEVGDDPFIKKTDSLEKYQRYLKSVFGRDMQSALDAFPAAKAEDIPSKLEQLLTSLFVFLPARRFANSHVKIGAPTYVYRFSRVPPFAKKQKKGSYHGWDTRYLFQSAFTSRDFSPLDRKISDHFQRMIVRFAKTGDPNHHGDMQWPAYTESQQDFIEIQNHFVRKKRLLGKLKGPFDERKLSR